MSSYSSASNLLCEVTTKLCLSAMHLIAKAEQVCTILEWPWGTDWEGMSHAGNDVDNSFFLYETNDKP